MPEKLHYKYIKNQIGLKYFFLNTNINFKFECDSQPSCRASFYIFFLFLLM